MGVSSSNYINIIYDINQNNDSKEADKNNINIFGSEFVKNNKNICKMIIDNKEYEIKEKYNINNYNNNILKIKLNGINNVLNMSYIVIYFIIVNHYYLYLIFLNEIIKKSMI